MFRRSAKAGGATAVASLAIVLWIGGAMTCSDPAPESSADLREQRERMVRDQIAGRDVRNPRVLDAMRTVPRHRFVPSFLADRAYEDGPLPIGHGQTISQPYIVASMTELVDPQPDDTILEIGTGSGYQAAVLAELVRHVYTVEIVPELADSARVTLQREGTENVHVITGDGYRGLPDHAPYDGIVVTAAPEEIPPALLDQLAIGARLVIPVGGFDHQELRVVERTETGVEERGVYPVRFVPLVRGEDRLRLAPAAAAAGTRAPPSHRDSAEPVRSRCPRRRTLRCARRADEDRLWMRERDQGSPDLAAARLRGPDSPTAQVLRGRRRR